MKKYQIEALNIAKYSILEELFGGKIQKNSVENNELNSIKSCFVTLKNGNKKLRGCIGTIYPKEELYKNIIENAKNAAFGDPRFPRLQKEELNNIYLEITILTIPEEKKFINIEELLDFLSKNKPGLLISHLNKQATFIPSVWDEIKDAEDFLIHLINKAGISEAEFIDNFQNIKFQIYFGEHFGEHFNKI